MCVRLDSNGHFCIALVVSVCTIPEDGSEMLACLCIIFLVKLSDLINLRVSRGRFCFCLVVFVCCSGDVWRDSERLGLHRLRIS